jgi:UDP-N-acetylmuramoylalanine-D-glutamate ligase
MLELNKKTVFQGAHGGGFSHRRNIFSPVPFTPCTVPDSLVEAVVEAAGVVASGDTYLLSPCCSGLEQFRTHEIRGQRFCAEVKSIRWGGRVDHPNMMVKLQISEGGNEAAPDFHRT